MKKIIRTLKMKRYASQERRKSPDPITAYRARIEVGIYDMLLDLIIKELEKEEAAEKVPTIAASTAQAA